MTDLVELRTELIKLGAMVCETIPRGTEVLLSGELGEVQNLIDNDDEIDRLSIEIEEHCHSYMVLQSPKAGELRLLVTATKLVAELERSADLMVNVCKAARRMYGSPMSPKVRGVVAEMAKEAGRLLRLSIDAFADADDALALALDDIDDELDQLNRDMVAAIFEAHSEGLIDLQAAVQLALIARYYERIGDHAVNIGQRVNYMVTGWLPEHAGALRAAQAAALVERPTIEVDEPEAGNTRLMRAMKAVPLGIVIGDANGGVVFENDFMVEFASGRHGDALVQSAIQELLRVAQAGQSGQRDVDIYGPPRRFLELWSIPVLADGEVSETLVIVEDVTENRRIEDIRRDFVANVSHELKTPVGAIGLLAETLNESDDPAVIDRLSKRLQDEVFRLGNTIDDLLTLSQIESGDSFQPDRVEVMPMVASAIERVAALAESRQVSIEVESGVGDGAGLYLRGDRALLKSAVGNLVDNAVKYSEIGGQVEVSVDLRDGLLTISVSDSGIGIPEIDRERIFERFYRVDQARSRETGGTGLGLSIVRHVMLGHNGEVSVQSQEGQGSTLTLTFPPSVLVDQAEHDQAEDV